MSIQMVLTDTFDKYFTLVSVQIVESNIGVDLFIQEKGFGFVLKLFVNEDFN